MNDSFRHVHMCVSSDSTRKYRSTEGVVVGLCVLGNCECR